MKTLVEIGKGIAAVSLILSLSSCGWNPQSIASHVKGNKDRGQPLASGGKEHVQPSASQAEGSHNQMQSARVLVDSLGKVNQELGIKFAPAQTTEAPIDSQTAHRQLNLLDSHMFSSFTNLAKLYSTRGEKQPQGTPVGQNGSDQDKLAYLHEFFDEQSANTMAFAYQLKGDYKQAAEILERRIAVLESANADGSRAHSLASSYSQYAGYLAKLGRDVEAQQILLKAHTLEPNHY